MRPERCARERAAHDGDPLRRVAASMRPERCARERDAPAEAQERGSSASMRPERCARERRKVERGVRLRPDQLQ